jgi:hypothetical protein
MPSRDGSKIILVQNVDDSGVPLSLGGGDATAANQATQTTALNSILTELQTPATYLPPRPVAASSDTTLTRGTIAISTATDTTLVSATAAQTTRLHRIAITVSAACTLTFKSNATSLGAFDFPSTGGTLVLDFSEYWWFKTATNEPLVLTTSAAVAVKGIFDYVKGA